MAIAGAGLAAQARAIGELTAGFLREAASWARWLAGLTDASLDVYRSALSVTGSSV
jgi:hypothetical protein